MTAKVNLRDKETFRQTQIQVNENTGENGDDCSPFCICSCCHFSTAYQFKSFSVTNKIEVSAILRANFSYRNPYSQAYKNSIWQPPKLNSGT
jgi:hypothetical protein